MKKPYFLKRLPDEDQPYLSQIQHLSFRPVFIMGLHRSGTTFLYETLKQLLSVAALSICDLTFYSRLLRNHLQGSMNQDQMALDHYFQELGLSTRPTDHIPLSHATLEEYGWLLMRHQGAFYLKKKTAPLFDEICRKLLFIQQPASQTVLMKSPWDTGQGAVIHQLFPQARFIYIHREPLEILNSQFKNSILFGTTGDPFLMLLLTGIPLGKLLIRGQQFLYRVIGETRYRTFMLKHLITDIARERQRSQQALKYLPKEAVFELNYEKLIEDPQALLIEIANFLELPIVGSVQNIKPRPRRLKLYPEIENRKEELNIFFKKSG